MLNSLGLFKKNSSRKKRKEIRKKRKLQITGLTIFAHFALLVNLCVKQKILTFGSAPEGG